MKMSDHSMGGFISASIASAICYFFTKNSTGLEAYLIGYVFSVFAYFGYTAMMKSHKYEEHWDSMKIFTGFFASGIAQWAGTVLCFIFGFPAGENILRGLF